MWRTIARAGRHVEADGRLVEQNELRAVQHAAGDLDAAAMAAVQRAHALVDAFRHVERLQRAEHALVGFLALKSPERGEVAQVLLDG